jgi:predicted nucleic acid-binding protein
VTATLLLDNSAWARLGDPALDDDRVSELADALEAGGVGTCLPFVLEAGYSARNARDHDQLLSELLALPYFAIDEDVEQRALDAQRQLARVGHHRLPPVDLLSQRSPTVTSSTSFTTTATTTSSLRRRTSISGASGSPPRARSKPVRRPPQG